ncbi:MAG: 30S ribosomal protein S13 [Candidatus Woesearchaeota archaeon]
MAEFKHIIRVANTDLQGNKQILVAMKKIKGVDVVFSNAALGIAGIDKTKKAGDLIDAEIQKINQILSDPLSFGIPEWMLNRRQDYETGEDTHITGPNLKLVKEDDIKRLKKIKSYKGLRHQWGLTVRGQRTKSNFRRNKGKVMGVKRKK